MHCSFFSLYYLVVTHSELPTRTLSEILAPSSLMVGRKFELNVDEWKFVGHPFSAQTVSFTTACTVIFVLQVNVFEMYRVCCCGYINRLCSLTIRHTSQDLKATLLKSYLMLILSSPTAPQQWLQLMTICLIWLDQQLLMKNKSEQPVVCR